MVVDPKGWLLNLSPSLALRKQLPLKQLVQLEFSSTNKTKATLVFTSVGLSMDADLELGGVETLYVGASWRAVHEAAAPNTHAPGPVRECDRYQLYMNSREERNEFISLLLDAHQQAIGGGE